MTTALRAAPTAPGVRAPRPTLSFVVLVLFVSSVPLEDTISTGVGRVSKLLGILAVALWTLGVARRGWLRRPARVHVLAMLFAAWVGASYFWADDAGASVGKIATIAQMVGVVVLVWDQVTTPRAVTVMFRAYVVGSLIAAINTVLLALDGQATEGGVRFVSGGADPNSAGCMLVIGLAIAAQLLAVDDRRWQRLALLYVPVGVVAVLLTASRTALVTMLVVGAILVCRRSTLAPRRLAAVLGALVVLALASTWAVPDGTIDRLSSTDDELTSGTLNTRTDYWSQAIRVTREHPVLGVGAGMFREESGGASGPARVTHNAFLSVAAELGLVGLVLFAWTVVATLAPLVILRGSSRWRPWLAIATAWLLAAMTLSWENRKVTWIVLALAAVEGASARRTVSARSTRA